MSWRAAALLGRSVKRSPDTENVQGAERQARGWTTGTARRRQAVVRPSCCLTLLGLQIRAPSKGTAGR